MTTILTAEMAQRELRVNMNESSERALDAVIELRSGRTLVITAERDKLDAEAWDYVRTIAGNYFQLDSAGCAEAARVLIAKRKELTNG